MVVSLGIKAGTCLFGIIMKSLCLEKVAWNLGRGTSFAFILRVAAAME
jgi:hypothetical protein